MTCQYPWRHHIRGRCHGMFKMTSHPMWWSHSWICWQKFLKTWYIYPPSRWSLFACVNIVMMTWYRITWRCSFCRCVTCRHPRLVGMCALYLHWCCWKVGGLAVIVDRPWFRLHVYTINQMTFVVLSMERTFSSPLAIWWCSDTTVQPLHWTTWIFYWSSYHSPHQYSNRQVIWHCPRRLFSWVRLEVFVSADPSYLVHWWWSDRQQMSSEGVVEVCISLILHLRHSHPSNRSHLKGCASASGLLCPCIFKCEDECWCLNRSGLCSVNWTDIRRHVFWHVERWNSTTTEWGVCKKLKTLKNGVFCLRKLSGI